MPETRLGGVKQDLVGALERLAGGNQEAHAVADGVEDDLTSIGTLAARLTPDQLRLVDIQDVFAHLLDHIIAECWDPAQKDQELAEALDAYIDMLASRLEAKLPVGARHSEKLENVFANYWEDAGEGDEDEEDEDGEAGREEELGSGRVLREIDPKTATISQLRAWYKEHVGYDPQEPPENLGNQELRQLVAEYLEEFKEELPARRPAQPLRPVQPRARPARFPKSADVTGDIEIGEE